jgi:hypothetical protein
MNETETTTALVIAPPADVILSAIEPEVRRHLWCEPEGDVTIHVLDDCWYECTVCGNQIRHVINEAKPLWAIR